MECINGIRFEEKLKMIDENNILETINMIRLYNLDIRTVTLALSLRDCVSEDIDKVCDNIYNKIKKYAKNLGQV